MINSRLLRLFWFVVLLSLVIVINSAAQTDKAHADKKEDADTLVVPSGTHIKVTFTQPRREVRLPYVVEGKVSVPVRVGWATAIPAGSKAFVTVVPAFYNSHESGDAQQVQNEMAVTAVIIAQVKYNVVTNSTALLASTPGTDAEVDFSLVEPLKVAR